MHQTVGHIEWETIRVMFDEEQMDNTLNPF